MTKLRIVISGYVGRYPLGGVAWDYVQYAVGLHRLGHDVYYIEDSGNWPYNPVEEAGCRFNAAHVGSVMGRFGMGDRWAYRCARDETWWGLGGARVTEVMRSADLLINVSGALRLEALPSFGGRSVFIDSDPVFTQVKMAKGLYFPRLVAAYDVHFTFGETLDALRWGSDLTWRPTRQPVLLDEWSSEGPPAEKFTTVMNWSSRETVELEGRSYGQKDRELRRFLDLPGRVRPIPLELALAVNTIHADDPDDSPQELLRDHGWGVVDPDEVCGDLESYARYIKDSLGEWSVAKNAYVGGRSGWFSCRSACYLAAGRPVVVQDTGFSDVIPTGLGILTFDDVATAVEALREVYGDRVRHSRAARELAAEYFDAGTVLSRLVEEAFMAPEAAPAGDPA